MDSKSLVRYGVRMALACGVTAGFVVSGSALAADQSQAPAAGSAAAPAVTQLTAVEVTGSRIKSTNVQQAQPVQIITAAQIKSTGLATIGDVLQTITSQGSALNAEFDNSGNGGTTGGNVTNMDLRNLGAQRTLVLVNGHRWATGLNGTVDLNTIPISIIDHVEILQDGASAIYGSDALAGVVNIITVKNFTGGEANAYTGISHGDGHWDGLNTQANFTIGGGGDHSNIVFNVSYQNQNPISSGDRSMTAVPVAGTGDTRGSTSTPQGRFRFIAPSAGLTTSPTNTPAASTGLTATQCPAKNFGTASAPNYLPFCDLTTIPGTPGTSPQDFAPYTAADNFNYAPATYIMTPEQTFNVYSAGHYDLADNLTFSAEANALQLNTTLLSAPPLLTLGAHSDAFLPANQNFNPFPFSLSTSAPVGPGLLVSVGRRATEFGDRIDVDSENMVHFNGGFNGFFDAGGSEWDWDLGYNFSKDSNVNINHGQIDTTRLDVQTGPSAGCTAQAAFGCVPLNFFGGQTNPMTPAQVAFASYVNKSVIDTASRNFYADITDGDVVDLPAGGLGLAAGYENLRNSGDFEPSAITNQYKTNPTQPTSGGTLSDAAYLEVDVPLLANIPFAKNLDLDVATRRTRNEVSGTSISDFNTSSRAGLKWQPSESVLFRGSWSQGFRSADISELFSGLTASNFTTGDPCSAYMTSGVPASVQQRCAAQGVPQSYVQNDVQIATLANGNPDLKPETSISKTLGFVYSPDWLPGFNGSFDYYKIVLENTIQSVGGANILGGCYFGGVAADCARVVREPNGTGDIDHIDDSVTNIGETVTSGYDISASYVFPVTSVGQFSASLDATYLREFNQSLPNPEGVPIVTRLAGIERGGGIFPMGFPRWKANGSVNWSLGNWKATWNIRYVGPMTETCSDNLNGTPFSFTNMGVCSEPNTQNNALSMNRLAAYVYHSAQVSYSYSPWNATFAFGIRNLFDKDPPVSPIAEIHSFDVSNYAIPGRLFYASVGVKF